MKQQTIDKSIWNLKFIERKKKFNWKDFESTKKNQHRETKYHD